jgi:hypothetical protein
MPFRAKQNKRKALTHKRWRYGRSGMLRRGRLYLRPAALKDSFERIARDAHGGRRRVARVGICGSRDLAKTVFELAIANAQWRIASRQRLNRRQFTRFLADTPATHIVMEVRGMAHDWGRVAQQHGHRVTLVPPAYVRPYVRRNKTDRADAEAILEAVRSGEMPSVPVKRVEQQALVALHGVREQWMSTRSGGSTRCAGSCASTACCCRPVRGRRCSRSRGCWTMPRRRCHCTCAPS